MLSVETISGKNAALQQLLVTLFCNINSETLDSVQLHVRNSIICKQLSTSYCMIKAPKIKF